MSKKVYNKLKNILFVDIETVSQHQNYQQLSDQLKPLWDKKSSYFRMEEKTPEEWYRDRGAIYSEFGRIVVLGLGYFQLDKNDHLAFRTKAFYFKDESKILNEFIAFLKSQFNEKTVQLCAHNGKEFDFPYLSRRMIINGIALPPALSTSGMKPWEIPHKDTMEMWKFGDYKNFTSLELLATILDIPSSKSEMDGSMVHDVYYHEQNMDKLVKYCLQDVVVCAQLYLKLNQLPFVEQDKIKRI